MERYVFGSAASSNVLIQPADGHDLRLIENEGRLLSELTESDFCLIALKVNDWNKDLSPWCAPAVFGNDDFGDGAGETLNQIMSLCVDQNRRYFLGGYSLAGLFALWAGCQTGGFSGIAAASPSVWFPGFMEYMETKRMKSSVVYLSLGDREEKTKNPVMAKVGECIRRSREILSEQGITCLLQWNPGNHFKDADLRTAKAFAWLLNERREESDN